MVYECEVCGKRFNSITKMNNHQCIWYCIDCCISFAYKHVYDRHMRRFHTQSVVKTKGSVECEYCHTTFASVSNRNRHTKVCKHAQGPIVQNITNITHNNINITNNTTNNIVIFGNEDFSYISKNDIQSALRTRNVLPQLCKLMRQNPHHPENRNIRVTDFSRGKTQIYGPNGWKPVQPIDTFNTMINEASGILDTKTYEDKIEYSRPDLERVDEITDKVHELDMAQWQGKDTKWGQENRRAIMLEFVD